MPNFYDDSYTCVCTELYTGRHCETLTPFMDRAKAFYDFDDLTVDNKALSSEGSGLVLTKKNGILTRVADRRSPVLLCRRDQTDCVDLQMPKCFKSTRNNTCGDTGMTLSFWMRGLIINEGEEMVALGNKIN